MNTNSDLPYVIIRSANSGVHAGYLISRDGDSVALKDSRRLWCWVVAKMTGPLASLSEVAVYGINSADSRSRIATTVPQMRVLGVCEVIWASPAAQESIEKAPQ